MEQITMEDLEKKGVIELKALFYDCIQNIEQAAFIIDNEKKICQMIKQSIAKHTDKKE